MNRNFDVLIVGGGIFGSAIFHHCLKNKIKRVALFEKNRFCYGSTGRSGGLIKFLHRSNKLCELSALSFSEFNHFTDQVGQPCNFIQTGFFTIEKEKDLPDLEQKIQLLQDLGIHIKCLTPAELKSRFNHFRIPDIQDSIIVYEQESGYADPVKATHAYISAGINAGGLAFENIEVLNILVNNHKAVGIKTSYGTFNAPCVVLATNACSQILLNKIEINSPILTNKVIQVDLFEYPKDISPHPSFIDRTVGLYGFDNEQKRYLLGTTTEFFPNRQQLSPKRTNTVIQLASERLSWISSNNWIGGRSGIDAYTDNGEGIAHFSSDIAGLFLCIGWSGVGFKMAPATAKSAAAEISNQFFV